MHEHLHKPHSRRLSLQAWQDPLSRERVKRIRIFYLREAFKGLTQKRLTIKYSVGQSAKARTEKGELLIRNW